MRKLLIILLTLCALNVSSQTSNYVPFPAVEGFWTYRYYGDQGEPGGYTKYTTKEDTLINNISYKKLMLGVNGYKGAYRDSNRVVYFIPDTSNIEYILYDFNLEAGDTIIHPFGGAACSNDTITVDYTDSVLISGKYHKTISFSSMANWIEGIGSLNYLLNPYQNLCLSGNDILRCMMNDSSLYYDQCVSSVSDLEIPNDALTIYPNPTHSGFQIQLKTGIINQVIITDIMGKVIVDNPEVNSNQIQMSKLPVGIYLVKILDNKGHYSVKKIVSSK